ncbi:uncharacterized protein LOC141804237 [Halichoeres trimaculatus]|uniref:uncharacterized protein LOC141804237 n=1 Tax=Halichoeres trimaculatus TaxID=147232 RepID=UPI003D9E9205
MKSDSGDYKARVSGDNFRVIAEYKVTVQDPVSPVNLTVKSCSSDFSNLTVSCSTQDSLISRTFTCDNQSCSEERGDRAEFTTRAASLKVYLKKDSIICVHSNQVSRTEDIRKIEDFCEKEQDPVSPVKLTVKSCSSDSSNLTVSCSTQDSLISRTFTCDNQSCSEERGDKAEFTTRAASLKVYLKKDSIICVHSNQVSRTEDIRKIEDFCEKEQDQESVDSSISVCKVKIIVISSGLIIMVCVVISVHVMEKVKKRK